MHDVLSPCRFRSRQYECLETGLNTSVPPRNDTTTTVELKSLSGKNQRNGLIGKLPSYSVRAGQ